MKKIIRRKKRRRRKPKESREHRVFLSLRSLFPQDPYIYGGYYSWLKGVVEEPLQIDIFFTKVGALGNRPLAVEVQGDQHRGRWRRALRRFFKGKDEFERQLQNDTRKKEILLRKDILLVEVWPEDDLSPIGLRKKIEEVAGVKIYAEE